MEEGSQDGDQPTTQLSMHLISSDQHRGSTISESNGESDDNRPLLLVKLTGSKLLSITLIVVYGTMKLIPAFRQSALTWLDVLLGVSTGIMCVTFFRGP